jgi:CheY-like chemotaxis protein
MGEIERILIIDDDEEDRDFFCQAVKLISPSIECFEAVDGADGLKYLSTAEHLPSCIFLDLNMPRVNGIQFLKMINRIGAFKEIPVIIYTTSKRQQDKDETALLGAVHFITKPYNLKELKDSIQFVLERPWEQSQTVFRSR